MEFLMEHWLAMDWGSIISPWCCMGIIEVF